MTGLPEQLTAVEVPRDGLAGLPLAALPCLFAVLMGNIRHPGDKDVDGNVALVFCDCSHEQAVAWVHELSGGVCRPWPVAVPAQFS